MVTRAVPYHVTAAADGSPVAETDDAVRVDLADAPAELWFPRSAVVAGALDRLARGTWREGTGELAGHVAFDPEQVDVTVIDGRPGDDERDVTTKRFPTWGDATDLYEVLDVRPESDTRYVSVARAVAHRPVVEASQILGQTIVAASRHAPGRRVVSASMVFPRAADARQPYVIDLDPITHGRSFTALSARATQGERTCAAGTLLLDVTADDVIRHADPMPDVPGPYESEPFDMGVTGRDLRIVDAAYTGDPDAPLGPPVLDTWVRFRDVPDDQALHAGLLAQYTGHMSIAASMRPHAGIGQEQAHVTLSTGINAIAISLHADVQADRWMLYHHRSTFAGDGMTHAECRVYTEEGALVASFTVDAMVRGFADPSKADKRVGL